MDHNYGVKGLRNQSADEDGDESSSCDTSVASSNPSFELESENHQNINDDDDNDDESESASTNVSSRSYHPQEGKDIFDSNEETDDENNVAENAVEQSDNQIIGDNVLDGNATQLLDFLDINEVPQLAGNIIMHEENISNNPSTAEENPDDTSNQKKPAPPGDGHEGHQPPNISAHASDKAQDNYPDSVENKRAKLPGSSAQPHEGDIDEEMDNVEDDTNPHNPPDPPSLNNSNQKSNDDEPKSKSAKKKARRKQKARDTEKKSQKRRTSRRTASRPPSDDPPERPSREVDLVPQKTWPDRFEQPPDKPAKLLKKTTQLLISGDSYPALISRRRNL